MKVLNILQAKLNNRTTEELKKDVVEAMNSNDETSIFIFSAGLSLLEKRLSENEYEKFENEL